MASIVVIDSEETVRSVVAEILARAGHAVRVTGDFSEALALLRAATPDLVLTNVYLRGGITGHDAMIRLKAEFPELRVLMVSGLPDQEVIHEWMGSDGFDIFPKPFTCDSLLNKVSQMLA